MRLGEGHEDVVIIGAGQAGLAAAWHTRRAGLRPVVIDAASRVGHCWRARYDSMRLFTPVEYNSLPGRCFPGSAGSYPGKEEVADYLEEYARGLDVPIALDTRVLRLRRDGDRFVAETTAGTVTADRVIVATGSCSAPYVPPDLAAGLGPDVVQVHSGEYRRPDQLPGGPVLVVGGGNSGVQIAVELAATGRDVSLAVGKKSRTVPQRPLGRDLSWWLIQLGVARLPSGSGALPAPTPRERIARGAWHQLRGLERSLRSLDKEATRSGVGTLIGTSWRRVRRSGVTLRPRVVGTSPGAVQFADGTTMDVGTVLWATGYRTDYSWLDIPGVVVGGRIQHTGGLTAVPGLAFVGLIGQRSLTSEWIGFVADDAAWVTEHLLGQERLVPAGAR